MNFAKFLRALFLHNASGRLLLLLLLLLFLILSVTIIFNIIIIIIIINFIFSIIDIIVSVTIFYRPIWVPIRVTEERYSSHCIRPSGSQVIGPELSDCGISYKQQIWLIKGRSCKSSLKGAGRKAFPFFFFFQVLSANFGLDSKRYYVNGFRKWEFMWIYMIVINFTMVVILIVAISFMYFYHYFRSVFVK